MWEQPNETENNRQKNQIVCGGFPRVYHHSRQGKRNRKNYKNITRKGNIECFQTRK